VLHRVRIARRSLVHHLAYNDDVAAGRLAVFRGGPSRTGNKAPIPGFIGAGRAMRKNGQLVAARRVALKMGRRPRCAVRTRSRASLVAGPHDSKRTRPDVRRSIPTKPTAHFEHIDVTTICETVHWFTYETSSRVIRQSCSLRWTIGPSFCSRAKGWVKKTAAKPISQAITAIVANQNVFLKIPGNVCVRVTHNH